MKGDRGAFVFCPIGPVSIDSELNLRIDCFIALRIGVFDQGGAKLGTIRKMIAKRNKSLFCQIIFVITIYNSIDGFSRGYVFKRHLDLTNPIGVA